MRTGIMLCVWTCDVLNLSKSVYELDDPYPQWSKGVAAISAVSFLNKAHYN